MKPLAHRQMRGKAGAAARLVMRRAVAVWLNLTCPTSHDDDERRREFLLNVILVLSIGLFGALGLITTWHFYVLDAYNGVHPALFAVFLLLFSSLYAASKAGHSGPASFALISIYAAGTVLSGWVWGASLPATMFGIALVIVTSGILLGPAKGTLVSVVMISIFVFLGLREEAVFMIPDWRMDELSVADIVSYAGGFLFIGFISWLSGREIMASLARARESESDLARERDQLEQRVAERTRSLLDAERERVERLERTARFGELSKGLFHDLMNPLSALSARIEHMSSARDLKAAEVRDSMRTIIDASKKIGSFMGSIRRSYGDASAARNVEADARAEAVAARDVLAYSARMNRVAIDIESVEPIMFPVHPVRLNQIFMNLLSNSIEACAVPEARGTEEKTVKVSAAMPSPSEAVIKVEDNGRGMGPNELDKAFEPGFSTKESGGGHGLSTVKHIVEKELHGSIRMESEPGTGTACIIAVPIRSRSDADARENPHIDTPSKGLGDTESRPRHHRK